MKYENIIYYYWYISQIIIYFLYFCIGLYITGFVKVDKASNYLMIIDSYVKLIISLFLIYKFNMFQKNIKFTEFDRRIVFQTGVFLLFTLIYKNLLIYYIDDIKFMISNIHNHNHKH
jgi:hypothetical protein